MSGGERVVVAIDWIEGSVDGSCETQVSTHLLDYRGLVQMLELIECLRQRGKATTCRTEEADYDGSSNAENAGSNAYIQHGVDCRRSIMGQFFYDFKAHSGGSVRSRTKSHARIHVNDDISFFRKKKFP